MGQKNKKLNCGSYALENGFKVFCDFYFSRSAKPTHDSTNFLICHGAVFPSFAP